MSEDRFDQIIQRALEEAARIECTPAQYRDSLREWVAEIQVTIQASEETDPEESG